MKITKRLLSLGITATMLMSFIPQTASADYINFNDRAQIKADDCKTGGWGTITLQSGKILSAKEGKKLESISASKSVFNQFVYNRGRNFYDNSSKDTYFAYDTYKSDYGAKIADGKYLYGIYDKGNDKGIYKVDFAAKFSSDVKRLIKKGDLEVAIVAEANNYKGSTNKQRGIAQLRFYGSGAPILHEITTQTNDYDGTRTVYADWYKPTEDMTRVMMNLRSERNKFTRKFNKSWVAKVRVFLRDVGAPEIESCKIVGGDFTSLTNVHGKSVYTAKIGSTIKYAVKFKENISVKDKNNLKLRLKSKDTGKVDFFATYASHKGDTIYFDYTVPNNTNSKDQLKVTADVAELINAKSCITDIAGNPLENESVAFTQTMATKDAVHTVDDTKTGFTSDAFDDEDRKPYSASSALTNFVYDSLNGADLYNGAEAQDLIFSLNGSETSTADVQKKPIFRIVLDDEIQKKYLNQNTKLKLQVYDANGKAVENEYVYAKLIRAGIEGVKSKDDNTNGIKSDARTELYFQYTPQKVDGYPIYKLNFAGTEKNGVYTFDDDAITCGDSKIKNISNMEVDGTNLKVSGTSYKTLPPFNLAVTIDTQAPVLSENNISSDWAKTFKSDTKLTFTDNGSFGVEGAKISLVHYNSAGKRNIVKIKSGDDILEGVTLSTISEKGGVGGNKVSVNLSNIELSEHKGEYPIYLEYSISDKAGNVATNKGQKNIEVHLDNIAPVVNSIELKKEQGRVTAKYDVTDAGVGKISPMISYVLNNKTLGKSENLTTEDNTQSITVTGHEGKLEYWTVSARFKDTVGNESVESTTPQFITALRGMELNFNDSADSIVSDTHHVTADTSKLPKEEAKFNVKFGWKRGSSATVAADAKTTIKFDSAEQFAKYDFSSDEIQKKYNSGQLFDGEFTLVIETVMMPEESKQIYSRSFYFDRKAPEGVMTVAGERKGINRSYDISWDLYDDASEYKYGAYVKYKNINFSSGNEPTMKMYIDGELAKEYTLNTFKSKKTIDFKSEFGNDEKWENASSAYAEIVFRDNFGHESTIKGEEMAIDLKAPVVEEIQVKAKNMLERGKDLYVVNSLNDIESISALLDDEAGDFLNIKYGAGNNEKQTANYEIKAENFIYSDFQYKYDDYGHYDYTFKVTDMGGNSTSRTVSFIVDGGEPTIYYNDMTPIVKKTNADSVDLVLSYSMDSYETLEDITMECSGAEIKDRSERCSVTLEIKNNGHVELTLRDKMGKSDTRSFDVSCFDRISPEIVKNSDSQKPEDGLAKYGTITMTASDNESLNALSVAMITGEQPNDNDFFTDSAEMRVISSIDNEADDSYSEEYSEERYFGENSDDAFAKLIPINPEGAAGSVAAGYKLSYGAIPDGTYNVFARVSDVAGNVKTQKIAVIETTSETASAETEYTPNGDRATGGDVAVKVTTDIKTRLLYGGNDDNIDAMKAHAEEMRKKGYTYTFDGEVKTLTFEEAYTKYTEIAEKYLTDEESLTAEEKYLVRYMPTYSNSERYSGYLDSDLYIDPENDLLDYLLNQCLYGSKDKYVEESYNSYTDVDTSCGPEVDIKLKDDMGYSYYEDVTGPIYESDILNEIYKDEIANAEPDPITTAPASYEHVMYRVDLGSYPEKIDSYAVPMIDKDELTPAEREDDENFINPFCDKETVTLEELYEIFGDEFDLSLVTEETDGIYKNPFGEDLLYAYYLTRDDISDELLVYMEDYIEENTKYYKNPFHTTDDTESGSGGSNDDGTMYGPQPMTYVDIKKTLRAVSILQSLREETAERAADKYVRSYISMSGNVFTTEHFMTFSDNVDREYSLVDEAGRITPLPININWIDHTKPYVPKENIKFTVNGEEFNQKYTNAENGMLEVMLPNEGVFAEYRLANIPMGAVGVGEETLDMDTENGTENVTLYRGFTLTVTENQTIQFDVLNPTSTEADKNITPQAYVVKCFDRTPPTYELLYSPQKPSNGADVNKDVTVNLSEIEDDFSGAEAISVSASSYTFTENGEYEFKLVDEAGNEAIVPVNVDYIDKTPTELTVKFKSGEVELDTDECFNVTSETGDYTSISYNYTYKGARLKNDVTAYVYFRGEQVQSIAIGDSGSYTYTYTRSNGSRGTVVIDGILFDKLPPTAEATYTYIEATPASKDAVRADITLADDWSDVTLTAASGSDNSGKKYTVDDVKKNADGTMSVVFNNNGNASLIFKDASGNATELSLSVTNLDRTAPRAFISYSSDTPTNSDVIANISLNKLADYQIYGENNKLLKDYSGAFLNYITYAFEDNGTRVFKFRDKAGNETEGLLATVNNIDKKKPELSATVEYNKMLADNGELVNYPGAATIILNATSEGDTLNGGEGDTILLQNAVQSKYHSVLNNGRYTFRYMDEAGNFDVLHVDVDGIDNSAPTATTTGNPTNWTNIPPEITVTANQKDSGIKTYIYQNGVKQAKTTITPTENGTYTFTVTDEIGNSATHRVEVEYVDTASPKITINKENAYKGNRDIYIKAGEFDKTAFEDVTAYDGESGLKSEIPEFVYGEFDQNKPGEYSVYVKASDIAGNETVLTRKIFVMGQDDVYAAINDQLIIPNTQVNYMLGEELKLSFVNAESAGNKVSYAFTKGFYNGAQLKGKSFKTLANPTDEITLEANGTGMYTLFLQTENRRVMVMYVFISG